MSTATTARLSPAELETYREDGLVIPSFRLSQDRVAELREAVADVISRNPGTPPEAFFFVHVPKRDGFAEGFDGCEPFFKLAAEPPILDMVEQLLGPDLILSGSHMFCKPPRTGKSVPWHQDGHYWPIRPLRAMTVWIAIDDSTTENGCMRYIAGSHKSGMLSHKTIEHRDVTLSEELDDSLFDESRAKDDELLAGQISFHDCYLIHGSRANESDKRRCGVTFRYMPASSHYDRRFRGPQLPGKPPLPEDFVNRRPIWLMRGQTRNPLNDFEMGHEGLDPTVFQHPAQRSS